MDNNVIDSKPNKSTKKKITKKQIIKSIIIALVLIVLGTFLVLFIRYQLGIDKKKSYNFLQSLDAATIEAFTWGHTPFSVSQKEKLVELIKKVPESDLEKLKDSDPRGGGSDFCIYVYVDGKEYSLWHTFIVNGYVQMDYIGHSWIIKSNELKRFIYDISWFESTQ